MKKLYMACILTLSITSSALAMQTQPQTYVPTIQKIEPWVFWFYGLTSLGIGFSSNYFSHNTKDQKAITNIFGICLTAQIHKSSIIKKHLFAIATLTDMYLNNQKFFPILDSDDEYAMAQSKNPNKKAKEIITKKREPLFKSTVKELTAELIENYKNAQNTGATLESKLDTHHIAKHSAKLYAIGAFLGTGMRAFHDGSCSALAYLAKGTFNLVLYPFKSK